MEEVAKLLYGFWSRFLPSYVEHTVPKGEKMPYLTYTLGRNTYYNKGMSQVRLWYHDPSFLSISKKIDEIEKEVGEGCQIQGNNGSVVIYKADNFVQFQPSDDPQYKIAYLNVEISYLF